MRQVGHLKELTEKNYDKGYRIIAVSKEGTSLLESKMNKDKEANYWIASASIAVVLTMNSWDCSCRAL